MGRKRAPWPRARAHAAPPSGGQRSLRSWSPSPQASDDRAQERLAPAPEARSEPLGDRGPEIREGLATAELDRSNPRTDGEQGHAFARVVARAGRWIVTVVGCQKKQIVLAKGVNERGQRLIELLKRPVEPRNVVPVPE